MQPAESLSHHHSPPPPNDIRLGRSRLARLFFTLLDTDGDERLGKQELSTLKGWLRDRRSLQPAMRKCGRNFIRHCDTDLDHRLTLWEWMDCVVGNFERTRIPHKMERNPFVYLLRAAHG